MTSSNLSNISKIHGNFVVVLYSSRPYSFYTNFKLDLGKSTLYCLKLKKVLIFVFRGDVKIPHSRMTKSCREIFVFYW